MNTELKILPVFDRADECSGNGYKCNGCGVAWGDHIALGGQCPGNAQQKTASQKEELNIATVDFALKAWAAHESGEVRIRPLAQTLKKKISGALTDCFPVHALSTRVEGHGTAHYRLCVTDGGKKVCFVMSKVDKNLDEVTSPFVAMETSMENILPAVRQYRYQVSRTENIVNADGVHEDCSASETGLRAVERPKGA